MSIRISGRILFFTLCLLAIARAAMAQEQEKQQRILLLLDGSSSMLQPWVGNENRFQTASKIITTLIDSVYRVNDKVEFGLRVYGHQSPAQNNNCFDSKREVMFSKNNLTQMGLRLESLHPAGVSPIAYSLKEAVLNDMVDTRNYNYSLILITDGGESCNGNICEVVKMLVEAKINFKPYIVSLIDYAPLKEQYDCMGTYLMVTKENEIPVAVNTIVNAYRPLLTMTPATRKLLQTTAASVPSVLKADIPKFKITTETEAKPEPKPAPKPTPPVIVSKPVEQPKPTPPPVVEQPKPTVIKVQEQPKPVPVEQPKPLPKETVARIENGSLKSFSLKYETPPFFAKRVPDYKVPPQLLEPETNSIPTNAPATIATNTPPPPAVKTVTPPPIPKPKPTPPTPAPKPKPVATDKPKEAKYNVQREEAMETTLEIYFTNGKGKFYETTPKIILKDPKTGKDVQQFYRMVNAQGNPDPQKIPVGNYDLTVGGKSNMLVRNIEVKANNKNKYIIQVNQASLRFEYEDYPNEPVAEFMAKVKKNFEMGPEHRQACTEEIQYEPGNYHIQINTLPIEHKSVDLDFDTETIIRIRKPGFVQFTNTNDLGKVSLYYQLGDKFVPFHVMQINGDVERQIVRLQHGVYRIGYLPFAGAPSANMKHKEFFIKSTETTTVELD
jgi:Cell division protein